MTSTLSGGLSEHRLAEIELRWHRATTGPWEFDANRHTHDSPVFAAWAVEKYGYIGEGNGSVVGSSEWIWLKDEDGEFIAHSWQDVRDLIDEVRRLRAAR